MNNDYRASHCNNTHKHAGSHNACTSAVHGHNCPQLLSIVLDIKLETQKQPTLLLTHTVHPAPPGSFQDEFPQGNGRNGNAQTLLPRKASKLGDVMLFVFNKRGMGH